MLDPDILCSTCCGHSELSRNASAMVPSAHCGECNQKQNQNLLNHIEAEHFWNEREHSIGGER